jgi:outer membrane protein
MESLSRQLEQAQQRFNVGLIAITDVLEAQSGFDAARSREIFARNNLDNSIEALREIIGAYDGKLVPLPEKIPLMRPEPPDINQWAFSADSQNLNIIAAQNDAEVARKTIELQRSGHYPTVDVIGSYNVQDNSSTFGLRGDIGQVGVQVNLPIFEGGAVNSRTKEALHNYNAAKDNLLAVRRQVARQVRNAYRGVISTISQVEALRATVKSSLSALEATSAGFEVGTRTAVDVVNEQRNLFQSQNALAEARNNYILNWVSLKESASNLTENDLQTLNRILLDSLTHAQDDETDKNM